MSVSASGSINTVGQNNRTLHSSRMLARILCAATDAIHLHSHASLSLSRSLHQLRPIGVIFSYLICIACRSFFLFFHYVIQPNDDAVSYNIYIVSYRLTIIKIKVF